MTEPPRLAICFSVWPTISGCSAAQEAVDLQIPVVAIGREAHHLVGPDQAAEAVHVGRRRGHAFGFVDDQAGEEAVDAGRGLRSFSISSSSL
jgi:hypothetical protein